MSLQGVILQEIRDRGPIPFSRYMELCLYHPQLGYYSRDREQFGRGGDFYTSSDVHAVFGRLLARQLEEMWSLLGWPDRIDLIELGPGRGLFACDVLDWSARQFPEFARALHYSLVEQSAVLRDRLRLPLEEHCRKGTAAIFETLEAAAVIAGQNVILFGNEFFDALPVEIIDHRGAIRVAEQEGKFFEQFVPPAAAELDFLDRYGVHPEPGGRVEVSLAAREWMRRIAAIFAARVGFAVFIDYGYVREQQLGGRHRDTLLTYRRHTASPTPYDAPGEQDITAHVNFTALEAAAEEGGLQAARLVTQSQFLIGIGESNQFADAFPADLLPQERAKRALQLRHLISPEALGEVFQVLVLSKGVPNEEAARLSGLRWLQT